MRAKHALLTSLLFSVAVGAGAAGSHARKGYVKKDGAYVAPSRATNPNDSKRDNYSSRPNTNPYTGKEGTKDPDAPKKPRKP